MKLAGLLLLGPILVIAIGDAEAGGYYLTDLGAKALARGGAFVAAPDSLLAVHYNPAGLSGQRGFLAEIDLSLFAGSSQLQRRCPCVHPERITDQDPAALDRALEAGFGTSTNEAGVRPIPFLGVGYGFEAFDLTVAGAVYGPHGSAYVWGSRDYDSALEQDQRYSLIESDSIEANYQLAVAATPFPGLRVGASLFVFHVKSTQYLHIYANTVLTPFAENVSTVIDNAGQPFDIPIELSFEDFAPGWSVGLSYEIIPGLSAGASFRGPRPVTAKGRLSASIPPILAEAGLGVENGGGDVEVRFKLPAIGRVGIEYRLPGLFSAEAAAVYEGWSVHRAIEISADSVRLLVGNETPSPLGTLVLEREWRDSVSLRLGGALHLLEPWLSISAGYFYEPTAIPTQRLGASSFDLDKHGVSLGLGTSLYGVTIQLALARVTMLGADVSDSLVQLPSVLSIRSDTNPDGFGTNRYQTRIGNGRYDGGATVATLGVNVAL